MQALDHDTEHVLTCGHGRIVLNVAAPYYHREAFIAKAQHQLDCAMLATSSVQVSVDVGTQMLEWLNNRVQTICTTSK